jgi:hypothetical protein
MLFEDRRDFEKAMLERILPPNCSNLMEIFFGRCPAPITEPGGATE